MHWIRNKILIQKIKYSYNDQFIETNHKVENKLSFRIIKFNFIFIYFNEVNSFLIPFHYFAASTRLHILSLSFTIFLKPPLQTTPLAVPVGASSILLAKCVPRSNLSAQLFKLAGMCLAGWARLQLQLSVVECVLLCPGILRRRSPMKRLSFVACRLSRLSPRTYLSPRQGREAATLPRGDGVCLNAWAIVGSHKCRLRAQGRGREVPRRHGDCRLHRLPQHNHLCLFSWRCDLAAPWACLYLNFEARIRGIQVVPGNAGAVHSVWVTGWWCRKWHKS